MEHKKEEKKEEKKGKRGRGKVKQMHIRQAASGGFIAKHPNKDGSLGHDEPDLQHVMADMPALQAHIGQNMGGDPEEGGEPEPAPQQQQP